MTLTLDRLRELRLRFRAGYGRTARDTLAALDELIARREADRWKPASEPPDTDRPVLVRDKHGIVFQCRYSQKNAVYFADYPISFQSSDVAEWRELPEAT